MQNEPRKQNDRHGDSPKQAPESGEPDAAGRSRGRVIDKHGTPAGGSMKTKPQDHDKSRGVSQQHLEAGRHEAVE